MRRRRPHVAAAAAALLTCCTPMRGAPPADAAAGADSREAAALLDETPPASRGRRRARRRRRRRRHATTRRPEAQGPVPTLVLPGDTLDDAPHMALAVAASFLASLWGVIHNAAVVTKTTTLAAVATGFVGAELFSGVFHWATDNYGSLETPVFGPACAAFQGHHGAPWTITHRSPFNNVHKIARMACPLALLAGVLMKPFAAIATSVLLWGQVCAPGGPPLVPRAAVSQPSFVRRLRIGGCCFPARSTGGTTGGRTRSTTAFCSVA